MVKSIILVHHTVGRAHETFINMSQRAVCATVNLRAIISPANSYHNKPAKLSFSRSCIYAAASGVIDYFSLRAVHLLERSVLIEAAESAPVQSPQRRLRRQSSDAANSPTFVMLIFFFSNFFPPFERSWYFKLRLLYEH